MLGCAFAPVMYIRAITEVIKYLFKARTHTPKGYNPADCDPSCKESMSGSSTMDTDHVYKVSFQYTKTWRYFFS